MILEFLDLSAAFDSLIHITLFYESTRKSMVLAITRFLCSYFNGQFVNRSFYEINSVTSGVPQGSVLHIQVRIIVHDHNLNYHRYTDDITYMSRVYL